MCYSWQHCRCRHPVVYKYVAECSHCLIIVIWGFTWLWLFDEVTVRLSKLHVQTLCACHLLSVIRAQFMTTGSNSALIIILFGQWGIHTGSVTSLFTWLTKGIDSLGMNRVLSYHQFYSNHLKQTIKYSTCVHMVIKYSPLVQILSQLKFSDTCLFPVKCGKLEQQSSLTTVSLTWLNKAKSM